mmetsp:Transcript_1881/g.4103  ORF Transcript_1881/g.4103 Transcript_1881/m.4103 type:complete len:707 (-) Transcript_1881:83-2203(-)
MASALRYIVAFGICAAAVNAVSITPVEQVIDLLSGLKTKLTYEGEREAQTYEEFACFCQNTTQQKSDSIVAGQDNIESLSASIQLETETKEKKQSELADRQAKQQEMSEKLAAENAAYAKEKAEYENTAAELNQAITGLSSAIAAMEKSKPASFLAIRPSVRKTLEMAEVLGFLKPGTKGHSEVAAFLQADASVDPSDPVYKFHSDNIIKVMEDVKAEFVAKKAEVDEEFGRRTQVHNEMVDSLTTHMKTNKASMDQLAIDIDSLASSIASNREDLVSAQAMLKDDQLYMKDLTERCETRAKEWDQRSQMRADELKALTAALAELEGDVKSMDEAANERAFVQKAPSLLQGAMTHAAAHPHRPSLLEKAKAGLAVKSKDVLKTQALRMLAGEGSKLHSSLLTSLVSRSAADPFTKVKELIQKLIERLLAESRDEATKKGFCDKEMSEAELQRDYRQTEVRELAAEIVGLKAKRDELEEEIDVLNGSVISLSANLQNATGIRGEEKVENTITVEQAREGLAAVTKAIAILKTFYKEAAKATTFLQRASPVDEDTAGAGFKGAYKGDQASATGVIGLLQVIKTDFERTIKNTMSEEKKAAADFVLFDRSSKADVGGKSTKIDLDEADLGTTNTKIEQKLSDLESAQDLLDKALQEIEALKPMCTDTTMPYEQRVQLREAEMDALKRALCILDTEGIEPECTSSNEELP